MGHSMIGHVRISPYFRRGTLLLLATIVVSLVFHVSVAAGVVASTTTYHISNSTNGGDCTQIGSWNAATHTCTLTTDVTVNGVDGIHIDSDGIILDGAGHTLSGNGTVGSGGVYLSNRSGVIITDLTVSQFYRGFYFYYSGSNTLTGNTVSSNNTGIELGASSNNTVSANNINSNSGGVTIASTSNSNTLSGNSISGNSYDGIRIVNSANGNIITGNSVSSNAHDGIYISSANNNQIYRNNFSGNTWQAYNAGTGNVFNKSLPDGGNYWDDWTTPDGNNDGVVDSAYTFTGGQDNFPWTQQDGWVSHRWSTYHISASAGGGDCALIGTWNPYTKTCTLNVDISFFGVNGIEIDSNNITLDGNGHTLTGDQTVSTNGVYMSGRNVVVVKDLTIRHFYNGIRLDNSLNGTISGNVTSANGSGILLYQSHSNILSTNTVYNNNYNGIVASYSNTNSIFNNTVNSNTNDGIKLINGSTSNDVWANNVASNGNHGVYILSSSNNELWHNNFISNTMNAYDSGGTGNSFSRPLPLYGGNYWSLWTSPDSNQDGIVDSSRTIFSGNSDPLPLVSRVHTGKPVLVPDTLSPFWASYDDYTNGLLSINWTIRNNGVYSAFGVAIAGSTDTNGVSLATAYTPMPATVGSGVIAANSSASIILKYNIPAGVSYWQTTLHARASDGVIGMYPYP